jgi:hypothetical protein
MSTVGYQLEELFDPSFNYPTLGTRNPETQPVIYDLVTLRSTLTRRLPDGMYLVLDIRHSASGLYEILDGRKIITFSMFESLTIMEHEVLIIGRDYFGIDVRHSCFDMRHNLLIIFLEKRD